MDYTHTLELEIAIARFFGIRAHTIVTNASWGMGLHECDLLIASKSGYLTEVEIKITMSDLKKDQEKRHNHISDRIKSFYFAIPRTINPDKALSYIPERAGLIIVNERGHCSVFRRCRQNSLARPLTESEHLHLARLGAMRVFGLKEKLAKLKYS